MTETAIAEKTAEAEMPEARTIPLKNVVLDMEGFTSRIMTCRLPEGWISDDLRDPRIWSKCQTSVQHSLRKYDQINIYGFMEDFRVEAVVVNAGADSVDLAITKVTGFRTEDQALWSDGLVRVVWNGFGYTFERCADGVNLAGGNTWPSEKIAAGYAMNYATKSTVS